MEINGAEIANSIIGRLRELRRPEKIFAAVLVGENAVSLSFLKQKRKIAEELGIDFRLYQYPGDSTNDKLRKEVGRIAKQKQVGGIMVQLPLPKNVNRHYILNAVPREKDIDVLGERALGAFYNNRNTVLPPTVGTTEEILKCTGTKIQEGVFAVVGRGILVGRPVSLWLSGICKEIYFLGKASDLELISHADVVISGVGKKGVIKPQILKNGAGVIDFGYYQSAEGGLVGDLEMNNKIALEKLGFYTPTPGGTGPILVAKLLENFYTLCGIL
jgi:methylenetetrahydrofolate dehydrogenase (NADP+)/methenyltetrahydrofolate cyclohydrolase